MQKWTLNDCTKQQLKAHQYFDLTGINHSVTINFQKMCMHKRQFGRCQIKRKKTKKSLFETLKRLLRTTNIKECRNSKIEC